MTKFLCAATQHIQARTQPDMIKLFDHLHNELIKTSVMFVLTGLVNRCSFHLKNRQQQEKQCEFQALTALKISREATMSSKVFYLLGISIVNMFSRPTHI